MVMKMVDDGDDDLYGNLPMRFTILHIPIYMGNGIVPIPQQYHYHIHYHHGSPVYSLGSYFHIYGIMQYAKTHSNIPI